MIRFNPWKPGIAFNCCFITQLRDWRYFERVVTFPDLLRSGFFSQTMTQVVISIICEGYRKRPFHCFFVGMTSFPRYYDKNWITIFFWQMNSSLQVLSERSDRQYVANSHPTRQLALSIASHPCSDSVSLRSLSTPSNPSEGRRHNKIFMFYKISDRHSQSVNLLKIFLLYLTFCFVTFFFPIQSTEHSNCWGKNLDRNSVISFKKSLTFMSAPRLQVRFNPHRNFSSSINPSGHGESPQCDRRRPLFW
jgi:hypothetical protein